MISHIKFDESFIINYPNSAKKIPIKIENLQNSSTSDVKSEKIQTSLISPYGLQFQGFEKLEPGSLLRVYLTIPYFWERKKKFVKYNRINTPKELKILGRVLKSEDFSKRGKKKTTLVETVNIDDIDFQVLTEFIEGKKC